MENNYYLPLGTKLGGHYEIEKVLNEDEFEILYLAKDIHKHGEYVILKELFLKSYSLREGNEVNTSAKSKIVFEETKKEVIKEIKELLEDSSTEHISTYGTFEENNTVYTIMEFVNNSNLDGYLKVNSIEKSNEVTNTNITSRDVMKEEIIDPIPKKKVRVRQKDKTKFSIFSKILIPALLICMALGYYVYNMLKEDKIKNKNRPITTISKEKPEEKKSSLPISKEELINDYNEKQKNKTSDDITQDNEKRSKKHIPEGAAYITNVEAYKKEYELKLAKEEAEKRAFEEEEEKLRIEEERALEEEKEKLNRDKKLSEEEENALEDEEEKLREEEEKKLQEESLKHEPIKHEPIKNEQKNKDFVPDNIREFMGEEETSNHPENDVPSPFKDKEENMPLGAVKPNILGDKIQAEKKNSNLLGTKIEEKNSKKDTTQSAIKKKSIKQFLNNFIQISGDGSIDEILSNYDEDVERYFSLRNVNHDTIRRDKINYHKKWSQRKFDMINYKVTKVYKNGDETFYDIKTTTNWSVSNGEGKSIAGTSKGVMTLRETDTGFKVTSIYTNLSK